MSKKVLLLASPLYSIVVPLLPLYPLPSSSFQKHGRQARHMECGGRQNYRGGEEQLHMGKYGEPTEMQSQKGRGGVE